MFPATIDKVTECVICILLHSSALGICDRNHCIECNYSITFNAYQEPSNSVHVHVYVLWSDGTDNTCTVHVHDFQL